MYYWNKDARPLRRDGTAVALGAEAETQPWEGLQISKKLIGAPQLLALFCFFFFFSKYQTIFF